VSYDFFLAHAGHDDAQATELYELLRRDGASVFLDCKSLRPGDDWDYELGIAQRAAQVTVVLVSASTDEAFYQRVEIANAIDMARKDKARHRVVPVYLDRASLEDPPYGLRPKHGLKAFGDSTFGQVAVELLRLLPEWAVRAAGSPGPRGLSALVDRSRAGARQPYDAGEHSGGLALSGGPLLGERCRALKGALDRVVPWIFDDSSIANKRLLKAWEELQLVRPEIAAWCTAARRETREPMVFDLRRLAHALETGEAALTLRLSALDRVSSKADAQQPCADLESVATALFDACAQAAGQMI
jgi:hypothetical protein